MQIYLKYWLSYLSNDKYLLLDIFYHVPGTALITSNVAVNKNNKQKNSCSHGAHSLAGISP